MERSSEHVAHNLLRLHFIGHISTVVHSSFEKPGSCKMVRSASYKGDIYLNVKNRNIHLVNKTVNDRLKPVVHTVKGFENRLQQKRVPHKAIVVLKCFGKVLFVQT
uniref:Uncharacterized protein n=1 Tax=Ogataea polymorpha TaxID=460523 RepID=Q2TV68_9ASCO|nr:unknown [Ogataea polymorpha]